MERSGIYLFCEEEGGASTEVRERYKVETYRSPKTVFGRTLWSNNPISPGLRGGGVALQF